MMLSIYISSLYYLLYIFSSFNLLSLFHFSFILFIIGLLGVGHNKNNFLIILICIEVMLISVSLNFIFISLFINKLSQVFSLFTITLAAGESCIGLGLLIILYRLKESILTENFYTLKN